jgi:hypothetical protein
VDIDWRWVAGVILSGLGVYIIRLQKDVDELKKQAVQWKKRARLLTLPFPSDPDEKAEIEAAREFARRKGIKLSFEEAAMVVERVRADRERKKAAKEVS